MGHIAHLWKKPRFEKSYYYNMRLIKKKIALFILLFENWMTFASKNSFTQGCLMPNLIKLAQWFWSRKFLNVVNVFSLFRYKYAELFIGTIFKPIHPRMLCAKFNWKAQDENVKCLQTEVQTNERTTDNRLSENVTWAFSSDELKLP